MLSVNNLNQFYGQSHTLWDLSFDVPDNACLCVLGRNGVGKTTLMQSIMGLAPLVNGEIVFEGANLVGKPPETRAPSGIAYIPQGRQIFSQLTVEENIKTGCFANKNSNAEQWKEIYQLFPVLLGDEKSAWWRPVRRTTTTVSHCPCLDVKSTFDHYG